MLHQTPMADQSSVPVKTIQKRLEQTKLTEDGSILKMLLDPAPKNTTICSWEKGATTKFHYTTHTFVKKDDEKREKPVNHDQNCKHHHHGHLKNPIQDVVIKGKAPQSLSPSSASSIETSDNSESDKPIRKKIADTREIDPDTPFEMKIGYNFSVPAFELCVKSMKEGERSRFLIMPEMLQVNLKLVGYGLRVKFPFRYYSGIHQS